MNTDRLSNISSRQNTIFDHVFSNILSAKFLSPIMLIRPVVLIYLCCLLFIPVNNAFAAAPVFTEPAENATMMSPKGSVYFTITHSSGADLDFAFYHANLHTLGPIAPVYTSININPIIKNNWDTQTSIEIVLDNNLIGSLRVKAKETNSSTWSEARTIRILPENTLGVAELDAWPDYENKIMVLSGKFLFYYSNQSKTARCVFSSPGEAGLDSSIQEFPQNTNVVNEIYMGIPFNNIPTKGDVMLNIEGLQSNKVSYAVKLPDLKIVSINGVMNKKEGDSTSGISVTVTNDGEDFSRATKLDLRCYIMGDNVIGPDSTCPSVIKSNGNDLAVKKLAAGETQTIQLLPVVSGDTWDPGKHIIKAEIDSTYHDKEKNPYNNKLQVVADVLPLEADWEASPKLLQIISPHSQQSVNSNLNFEVLVSSNNTGQNPTVELVWSHYEEIADNAENAWPAPPEELSVIPQVTQYKTVIPYSAFPKKGRWRVFAYIKDPNTGGVMVNPDTNQPLEDTRDFYVGKPKQSKGFEITNSNPGLTNTTTIKPVPSLKMIPLAIISPPEDQKFGENQPVPISFRSGNQGKILWDIEKKEFGKQQFSRQKKNLIRLSGVKSNTTISRATLKTSEPGYYRFRFRENAPKAKWSGWRTVIIGTPTVQIKAKPAIKPISKQTIKTKEVSTKETVIQRKPVTPVNATGGLQKQNSMSSGPSKMQLETP